MRDVPKIWDAWRSGLYVGDSKPATRVTVEESFFLTPTAATIGQWERGPARWFQRKDLAKQIETEVPGVLNVSINRSTEPDAGTCDISIRNVTAPTLGAVELPAGQFSDIGHYTPDRGEAQDASARWGHAINLWHGVLVPNALVRTYQGFGGHDKTVRDAVADGDIVLNGVWLVDDVTIAADGTIALRCRDMMKLLIDQQLVPPLVPHELYPLQYQRYRIEDYPIPADPPLGDGIVCPGARYSSGPGWHSSTDEYYGAYNTGATGHPPSDAFDMGGTSISASPNWSGNPAWPEKQRTFWLSEPMGGPDDSVWIEFDVPADLKTINEVFFHTWKGVMEGRGCHVVMVSVWEFGDWVYPETWSPAGYTAQGIPYVCTFVPGTEMISGKATDRFPLPRPYFATKVRLTVTNLLWADDFPFFSDPDPHGGGFRGGAREVMACYNPATDRYPALVHAGGSIPANKEGRSGYWQVRTTGSVFAFGDARTYPAQGGMTHVGHAMAFAVHPSGEGYWTLDESGRVLAYGAAQWHQDPLYNIVHGVRFTDIASSPTGNGYWVLRNDGVVFPFGDAQNFGWRSHVGPHPDGKNAYAQSMDSHPTQQGYWVLWTDGFIDAFNLTHYGHANRNGFPSNDWVPQMKRTSTGKGYWVISLTGIMQAMGDAVHKGNASPAFGYAANEWFRPLCWDIYPSCSGDNGYLIERLDGKLDGKGDHQYFGSVGSGVGQLRYEGNYKDYSDIIRDLLLWAGFYFQRDDQPEGELPDVYGDIQTTGIYAMNDPLPQAMFDKRPILDAIRDIRAIVNYAFFVDAEGAVRWEVPNWWQMGNYLTSGSADGRQPFNYMPEIDEAVQLTSHSVTRSGQAARSEIILATEYPYATVNGQKVPEGIVQTRITGSTASDLKGIISPAIWHNGYFLKPEEQRTMAELLDMQIWFQRRTANITCVANPLIDINDQVRVIERQTGDVYVHYIKAISFTHDLTSGSFTMSLTTHWLGGTPYGMVRTFYACAARPQDDGYWQISASGTVYAYGAAELLERNESDSHLSWPIAMRPTSSGYGYWTLDQNGKVLSYGDAANYGDLDLQSKSAIDLAITPSGNGYWILLLNGQVHTFGDAINFGDVTPALGAQARSIESHPTGLGYWILQSNGTVEAFNVDHFGDADRVGFRPAEITSRLRCTPSGEGYRIVSTSGIVQSFGAAGDHGSGIAYPEGAQGMVWDLLVNETDGYAIQRANGVFEVFDFDDIGLTRVTDLTPEWALVTEDAHRELTDPSMAYPVSSRVIDFLKGTSSPSANNAATSGFNSPTVAALEGSTTS
jgi:hypothetical protein